MNEMYKKKVMKIMMMENIKVEILFEVNKIFKFYNSNLFCFSLKACVTHVDTHKEEIQLTIDSSTTRSHSSKKLVTEIFST